MSAKKRLKELRNSVSESVKKTKEIHHEKSKAKGSNLVLTAPKVKKAKTKKVSASILREAMKKKMIEIYGSSLRLPYWGVKENTLAKKLIDIYGLDLAIRGVEFFVEDWANLCRQSRGRVKGVPTINFLWSAQGQIFGDLQASEINFTRSAQSSPANSDEFKETEDKEVGW